MLNLFFAPINKMMSLFQRTFSFALNYWWLILLGLFLGFTFEEVYHGFRIIKYLGFLV